MGRHKEDEVVLNEVFTPPLPRIKGCTERWVRYKNTNYWVSDEGRIWNDKVKREKIPNYHNGIACFGWREGDKVKTTSVAKAVWETFKGEVPDGYFVVSKFKHMFDLYSLEIKPKNKVMYNKGKKVVVNGKQFNTCEEASKVYHYTANYLRELARGKWKIEGLDCYYVEN